MRRRPPWSRVLSAASVLVIVAACGGERPVSDVAASGGRLVLIDSVVLRETDSVYVGRAAFAAQGPAGELLVSDQIGARVLRFDRQGTLLGVIARKGRGPGELRAAGPLGFVGDTLLAVVDHGGRVLLFRHPAGDFVRDARYEMGIPINVVAAGGVLWMGHANPPRGTSLARWDLAADRVEHRTPMPEGFRGTGLEYAQPFATVAAWRDTLLVAHALHPRVILTDGAGTPHTELTVPVARRRGLPDDLLARYRELGNAELLAPEISMLMGAWRMASGHVALLHLDLQVDTVAQRAFGGGWLTVLRPDLSAACVDLPVEGSEEGLPVVAFAGDTLLRVDQRTLEGALRAQTVVRRFRLDTSACEWTPVPRGAVGAAAVARAASVP